MCPPVHLYMYIAQLVCYGTIRYIFFYSKELVPIGFDELEVHSLNHCFDCSPLIGCVVGKVSMFFSLEFTAEHDGESITHSMYYK